MIDSLRSGGIFDFEKKEVRLQEILEALNDPSVWEDLEKSQELNKERSQLEKTMNQVSSIEQRLQDSEVLLELSISEKDEEILTELTNEIHICEGEISKLEQQRMFSGEMDSSSAFLDIQAGSGGTEAQDWANMLLRMYLRYCESNNFNAELIESSPGEVAGIKSATIHITGEFAFGWLKTETGVHRLVRKSPFDSGNRRHTSFAAIFVSPEIDDDIEIDDAYQISRKFLSLREDQGEKVIGKKIGVTSPVVQEMLGVNQPDFGFLTDKMQVKNKSNFSIKDSLIQPRAEAEIAFILKENIQGPELQRKMSFWQLTKLCHVLKLLIQESMIGKLEFKILLPTMHLVEFLF